MRHVFCLLLLQRWHWYCNRIGLEVRNTAVGLRRWSLFRYGDFRAPSHSRPCRRTTCSPHDRRKHTNGCCCTQLYCGNPPRANQKAPAATRVRVKRPVLCSHPYNMSFELSHGQSSHRFSCEAHLSGPKSIRGQRKAYSFKYTSRPTQKQDRVVPGSWLARLSALLNGAHGS